MFISARAVAMSDEIDDECRIDLVLDLSDGQPILFLAGERLSVDRAELTRRNRAGNGGYHVFRDSGTSETPFAGFWPPLAAGGIDLFAACRQPQREPSAGSPIAGKVVVDARDKRISGTRGRRVGLQVSATPNP